jgi:uncharacterized protein (DUF2236 family)
VNLSEHIGERFNKAAQKFLTDGAPRVDFTRPAGEPALLAPDSVSWRVFKNPVALFVGGVTAVLLEFAEPRVRSGVWDHSTFRKDPVGRLKRTGLAAMVTVYGARSVAEKMIAGVRRMHDRINGATPSGEPYAANDPELLNWVHATASFGFLEAYCAYVYPLTVAERDRFYAEGKATAALYGATSVPGSVAEQQAMFAVMSPRFERSDIVFEFLDIMRRAKALPPPVSLTQGLLLRAAIDILPGDAKRALGLGDRSPNAAERLFVRRMGWRADRIVLRSGPAAQSCLRLGLPADHLYRTRSPFRFRREFAPEPQRL